MSPRKKYQEIADHLELRIMTGQLGEGDKLPSEREIMAQFGAGRSSVREAMFALQRKGLVSARAGTAGRVTRPSVHGLVSELSGGVGHLLSRPEGIRDLQNARLLLEVGLARNAALAATSEDLARVHEALEANRVAADQEAFAATDMAFHDAIAQVSRNDIFTALSLALIEWLAEQRRVTAEAGASFEEVHHQHRAIFEAIERRDPVGAQDAMQAHLEAVAANYWRRIAG